MAKDLACPCECPLILEDCNMTCGLDWKEEIGEMVKAGKTKQEIMTYFIATYGEEARLTTLQKIDGKIYQYTRGFGTTDWAILWAGVGVLGARSHGWHLLWRQKIPHPSSRLERGFSC